MMILIWILLGVGIYYLFVEKGAIDFKKNKEKDAEDALKLRYVKGEIDDQTYEKMKKLIKS